MIQDQLGKIKNFIRVLRVIKGKTFFLNQLSRSLAKTGLYRQVQETKAEASLKKKAQRSPTNVILKNKCLSLVCYGFLKLLS